MALKIFGGQEVAPTAPRKSFADDVVGRVRSGYQIKGRPQALTEWRFTSDDPEVTDRLGELFGGDTQEWEAKGDDRFEVFTTTSKLDVVLHGPTALRERMILWSRNGKIIFESDGEVQPDGTPDPDASLSFAERKQKARDGIGPEPNISLAFRLAEDPDLGIFRFQTGSWSMASDLARDGVAEALEGIDGPTLATLELEGVSFIAKNGPRAGQTVSYTKPRLKIKGAAKDTKGAATDTPW